MSPNQEQLRDEGMEAPYDDQAVIRDEGTESPPEDDRRDSPSEDERSESPSERPEAGTSGGRVLQPERFWQNR